MSFYKGEKFEDYTKSLFPASHFDLLHRTPDYDPDSKQFDESCLRPDFKFKDKKTGFEFYVESKYRKAIYGEKLEWCNYDQLKRYKEYDKEAPVFVLIGLEGKPYDPEFVFFIPLKEAPYMSLYDSVLRKHEREPYKKVKSKELWG